MFEKSQPPQPKADQRQGWNQIFESLMYPLSGKLTEHIEDFSKEHQVGNKIIELACGLNPSSDVIHPESRQRILLDIADVEKHYQDQPDTTFIRADLSDLAQLQAEDSEYSQALNKMGKSFDVLVVGSGINYFDWKKTLPSILQNMETGGHVFLFTGIFTSDRGNKIRELVDNEHRPRSLQEIVLFLLDQGYEVVDVRVSKDQTQQEKISLVAKKVADLDETARAKSLALFEQASQQLTT